MSDKHSAWVRASGILQALIAWAQHEKHFPLLCFDVRISGFWTEAPS
jgi:hypothetical protein